MALQYLILGLLKYGPQSGYDLNRFFRDSVRHFWNTEQSQIYRALHKMHEVGWVRIEQIVQENLPDKKVYHLTEKGREALQGWLATPQALAQSHEAWLGQIFFGAELRKEQFKQVLEQRAIELQQLIQHFEQEVPGRAQVYAEAFQAQFDLPYWLLTLDFGLQKLRFELHWIQATQATLDLSSEKENEAGE